MSVNDANVQNQLLQFADSIGREVSRRVEKDLVKPMDSLYGEWMKNGYKSINNLLGFNDINGNFLKLLASNAEQKASMRGRAPPEQFTFVWNAAERMVNAKVNEMVHLPSGGKKIPMMVHGRMLQLVFKILLSDMDDEKKQRSAFLDEVTKVFGEIKKILPAR